MVVLTKGGGGPISDMIDLPCIGGVKGSGTGVARGLLRLLSLMW